MQRRIFALTRTHTHTQTYTPYRTQMHAGRQAITRFLAVCINMLLMMMLDHIRRATLHLSA